ncbi:KDGP aldolase [Escherichia coli]
MQKINFYRNRVAINVLAKDIANAREIFDAAEGHAVIGVLSAQFSSVDEGIQEVKRWMAEIPSISVGLGAGDPAQYYKAAMIRRRFIQHTLTRPLPVVVSRQARLRLRAVSKPV